MVRTPSPSVIATPRIMALTAGAFYTAGGAASLAVILSATFPSPGPRHVLLALATVALLGGVGLLTRGQHLPRDAFHGVVGGGTLLITLSVPLCPTTATALAISTVYAFVAIDVMFFFRWAPATAHLTAIFLGAAWALHDRPGVTVGVAFALATVLVVVTAVVGVLVRVASDAHHDSLTGLRNRRGFDAALDAALLRARTGTPLAAVLLDVDHFKTVNDAQGHAGGDRLLQSLAHELTRGLPAAAVLARYGGDEFAVLLPGTTGGQALDLLSGLRESLTLAGFSAGVAGHLPGETGADLLRRADTALYAAKTAGRGRCRLDDRDSADLARDLADALAAGDVRAWFQPIVEPATGRVVGVEALARWTHPTRGPVRPDEFVAVAETTGLVAELGAAVLADACRGARALTAVHGDDLLLTVNVSGRELVCPDYADRALGLVAAAGWPVAQLVVEVTESLLDGSSGPALRTLERLRAAGAAVAIDDFGTGYSAFSRLDTLPADYLKLDHGFTAQIATSQRRAALLTALLSLSGTLGLTVIAEGVETPEQADLLARAGCPLTQGYLFSRPAPAEELVRRAGRPAALPDGHPEVPALPARAR
ncbi:putative bifunctional diguanylate cyclase/phosphodiesterase [Kineococcus sp. SYSU DK001]|uniref:putative bifunctional diguanylate cyclase/phosphodiesterase n=1 Tax=Kineococcus sp. SYSU DK001 TaxID=3383122 RepID=UPI003D7E4C56